MTSKEAPLQRARYPIRYPQIEDLPNHFSYLPSYPLSFMHVSLYDVEISHLNLEYYLKDPDEFIQACKDALDFMQRMRDGYMPFRSVTSTPLCYHVYRGQRKPMSVAPWERVNDTADYLTVTVTDPMKSHETIGVTTYMSMAEHERLISEYKGGIQAAIRDGIKESTIKPSSIEKKLVEVVTTAVQSTVDQALTKHAQTLEEIQGEKRSLEKRLKELDAAEKQEIERQRLIAERQQIAQEKRAAKEAERIERRKNKSRAGYVYILKADNGTYKIGRTATPENRVKTFGVELPFDVEYEHLIQTDDMYRLEAELHAAYSHKNIRAEWFALDETDIATIKAGGDPQS